MKTNNDQDIEEFNHAQATYFAKKWAIVKSFFSSFDNIASPINQYATLTNVISSLLSILSMLPIIIGPIGLMVNIIQLFTNPEASLATKLIGLITQTGSSATSMTSLFLQSLVAPLAIVGGSLGFIRDLWNLGELLYRRYYKKEAVSSASVNEAIHSLIVSAVSLVGSILLLIPVTTPFGYGILIGVGAYRLADTLGFNPLKKYTNWFKEDDKVEQTTSISSENITNTPNIKPATTLLVTKTLDIKLDSGVSAASLTQPPEDRMATTQLNENKLEFVVKRENKETTASCLSQ